MIKVVSVTDIRAIEAEADAKGLSYARMMENAGRAVADRVIQHVGKTPDPRVTVLAGAGNNGGDGLVAGRFVAERLRIPVRFYLLKARADDDVNLRAVQAAKLTVVLASDDHDGRVLRNMVASADIVVDALFGIGIQLPLRAEAVTILRRVNQALNDRQAPEVPDGVILSPADPRRTQRRAKPYVIAVDCPSGLDCDTGQVDPDLIQADETVTFIAAKRGLLTFPGASAVGELHVATIGIDPKMPLLAESQHLVASADLVEEKLPVRPLDANKGTFGKAAIWGGSPSYVGAVGLAAMSAYRSGVGLVTVTAPPTVVSALGGHLLEPTWLPFSENDNRMDEILTQISTYNAMLIGPGWGRGGEKQALLLRLLSADLPPLVIDADGLNTLAEIEQWWTHLPAETILTPHPGEMGRLAAQPTSTVQASRWETAAALAAAWKVIVVLKGAHTLIAGPDGRVTALPFKSDVLSTAGTGDVLAGLITGFLAQGVQPYDAAVLGGYVHGLAGQIAAGQQGNTRSMIASDLLDSIPDALAALSA